jgi:malate dehydrogenase (oxaloacetate-decarboxylating)
MAEDYQMRRDGASYVAEVSARGRRVLRNPMLNAGTAFTEAQREELGLVGLLPPTVLTIEQQQARVMAQLAQQPNDLAKFTYLSNLQNRNEVLFAKVVRDNIADLLPIVYTPTIAQAVQEFSQWFQRPRGVYLDIDHPERIEEALLAYGKGSDEVDLIVATDSEAILGLGDQGVAGIMVAVGKLAVYTAAGGIHPSRVLPVVLDTGTDNQARLGNPLYLGLKKNRVRGAAYDEFVETYVRAAHKIFPNALLHWEDFAAGNATRILEKYRGSYCTFNDDIQGSAAVVAAAVLGALGRTGGRIADQRFVIMGAGSSGIGAANLLVDILAGQGLTREEARARIWGLNSSGLMVEGGELRDFQVPFARPLAEVAEWGLASVYGIGLEEVVRRVRPTVLIGTSGQPGVFTRAVVEAMAESCARPVVLALGNPTSRCEAVPADVIEWSRGRALVATGSPWPPVEYGGVSHPVALANNSLVFPGIGLGAMACHPRTITDSMVLACAEAVAAAAGTAEGAAILPGPERLPEVAVLVAEAFVRQACAEGSAQVSLEAALAAIPEHNWVPVYPEFEAVTTFGGD